MAFKHGSFYAYQTKKCRCEICTPWWNNYMLEYRHKRERATGEVNCGRAGGFIPGKPCACGCGLVLPENSRWKYKRGHKPTTETAA